ncbi:PREDICTED: G patch domain-containing protein 4 [Aptenodytes forsteri]|nr:PREDICTED: G patch domain-containing protein 4 [Aptenodytes forsteri]
MRLWEDGGNQDGISVKTLSEQGGRITNKKPRKAGSAGSMLYGRFVKSATLTACGEESTKLPAGSESSEEEEKLDLSSARRLTDEELMRVCGGRTAHKGARHGLTMSAKLARLEEQERAFLATYQHKEQQHEPPESSPPAERQEIRKKKRRQSRDGADAEVLQSQELSREEEVAGEEGKAVKRKKKKNQELSGEEEVAGEEGKAVKRKKKKNQELSGEEEVAGEEGKAVKRKKKKNQELSGEEEVAGEEGKAVKKKKKKSQELSREEEVAREKGKAAKRTKKQQGEEDKEEPAETEVPLEDTDGPDQAGHSPRKKRKKRKRKPE